MIRLIPASVLLCIAMICLSWPSSAMAQAFGRTAPVEPPPLTFSLRNKQLQDILRLQYQIQLLKQMIDHEKAVNEIVKTSISLGIQEPNIPAPNQKLCSDIPANIPCAQAYDSLYAGYSAKRVKTVATPIHVAPSLSAILDNSDIPFLDAATLPELPANAFDTSTLFWTDITCLGGACSAVITPDPDNPRARYRVTQGEILPDGAVINHISAAGVKLLRNGRDIALKPAPRLQ